MMLKRLGAIGLSVFALSSCAIDVTSKAFFYQDSAPTPLTITTLHAHINSDETSAGVTRVELKNGEGITLRGVAVAYAEPVANIVFFPDNRMPLSENNGLLHRVGSIPANVLWMDYQGVGSSDKSSMFRIDNVKADALITFDYVKGAFDNSLPTILHGRGIGAYFASYVAANRQIDGLVLDGAFNDISDYIANMMPGLSNSITSMRLQSDVHNMQIAPILRHYDGPLWLVVGEKDVITPPAVSEALLAESLSARKHLSIIPNARHKNTLMSPYAVEEYRRFLSQLSVQ